MRLGFRSIQEYRFHLRFSCPKGKQSLRPLKVPEDKDLFYRLFADREPLSHRVWMKDHGSIAVFNTLFATYPTYWSLHYSASLHCLLSYVVQEGVLHLYDIIANPMPSLEAILDHLPGSILEIDFYFPPDQLTDAAVPEPFLYDHGHLMVHGEFPYHKRFMIAPLSRC